jgi:hypothetical protein
VAFGAVSLTFHSDDMSAERALARLRSGFGGGKWAILFPVIFVID